MKLRVLTFCGAPQIKGRRIYFAIPTYVTV